VSVLGTQVGGTAESGQVQPAAPDNPVIVEDSAQLPPGQFQAIVGLPLSPVSSEMEFVAALRQFRALLDRQGYLYLSLPNRHAWRVAFRRTPIARGWSCGYLRYRRLFTANGFCLVSDWASPLGYEAPDLLIPYVRPAMVHANRRWNQPGHRIYPPFVRWVKDLLAQPWLWRLLEADYVFLLRKIDA
jgi:hypothetical protein